MQYELTDNILHSDFSTSQTVINQSIDHLLCGWIQKVEYYFTQEIPMNNNVVLAGSSYLHTQQQSLGNPQEAELITKDFVDSFGGTTEIVVNRTFFRPWIMVLDSSRPGDAPIKHTTTLMEWVNPGDKQTINVVARDISAAPTGGDIDVRITVTVIIAAFGNGRSKKHGSAPAFILMYGTIAGSAGLVQRTFIPETDMRLYACAGFYWGLTVDDEAYLHFGSKHLSVDRIIHTGTDFDQVLRNVDKNSFMVGNIPFHSSDTTTTDQDQFYGFFKFRKKPLFLRQREPWNLSINNESGNDNWFYFSAQVMPDYQNAVDWQVEIDIDESADSFQYFTLPYDIYVNSIDLDIKFSVLAAQSGNTDTPIDLLGIMPGVDYIDSSSHGYGFLEYPEGSTSTTHIRHNASLERIYLTAPPGTAGGLGVTNSYSAQQTVQVNEYYPRGSRIGISSPALSTLSDVAAHLMIRGIVAKKTGKRDALSFLVEDQSIMDIDTLQGVGIK
jgi:hypothetical protein